MYIGPKFGAPGASSSAQQNKNDLTCDSRWVAFI